MRRYMKVRDGFLRESVNPDLDYELQGFVYSAPPGGPPFALTDSLSYALITPKGEEEPDPDEDD